MEQEKKDVLVSVRDYILRLIPAADDFVSLLRKGDTTKALKSFPQIIDGLEWTISAVMHLKGDIGLDIDATALNANISELLGATENLDYILLADIMEYEIVESLNAWNEKIQAFEA